MKTNNKRTMLSIPPRVNKKGAFVILLFLITFSSFSQWSANFQGIDSLWANTYASPELHCFYNDGDSVLYAIGYVVKVNTDTVNSIFKWNGNDINKLNNGLTISPSENIIQKYRNNFYVGGGFLEVDNLPNTEDIAMWDGTNWHSIDDGTQMIQNTVYDMEVYHDTLYVGGNNGNNIMAYDTAWIYVGEMNANRTQALIVYNDKLYAGGNYGFRVKTGATTWEDAHEGPDQYVMDMEVDTFNNFLYVGGAFYLNVEGENSTMVAMWDGFRWTSMGTNINCDIYENAMAIYRGDLYVGGCLDELYSGLDANYIARWDGENWHALDSGCNSPVCAITEFRDTLIVGGYFR